MDFSTSLFAMDNRLFMQIPDKALSWTTFIDVYEKFFWVVVVVLAVVLTVAIYLIHDNFMASLTLVAASLVGLSVPIEDPRRWVERNWFEF